jgi:signal transduction histidine kinase/ligand-binding sensor domain-containing protein/DNA-binding response OmpR family regulator
MIEDAQHWKMPRGKNMKLSQKEFLAFFVASLIPFTLGFLLHPQSSAGNIKFVRYSTLRGLSSNSQKCVTQDKEGFIWVGTVDGLNRFDGYTFKVYRKNPADTSSLRSNLINCLYTDSKGNLWVGTYGGGGLSLYNKEKDIFYTYPLFLNNNINSITEDKYRRVWIGTTLGLYMFDPKRNNFTQYLRNQGNQFDPNTIAYNEVDRIVIDDDILWIAYSTGILSALNTTSMTFRHYKLFDVSSRETADFSVNSLALDNGKIWISTWSKGIWIFDRTSCTSRPYENEKSRYINFIFKDTKNRLWYSPEYEGLVLIDGQKQISYEEDDFDQNSISSNLLSNIFQDREGNLWVTSKLGDLNCVILDSPFRNWHKNPNSRYALTSNLIYTVVEDSRNRIWVGYEDGGIDILDAKNAKPRIHIKGDNSSGLGPGPVMDIFESKNGAIWIGKYLDGLRKYNEETKSFASFKHIDGDDKSVAGNDVRYISEDSQGNLWVALHGAGVDMYDPRTGIFTHHKHDDNNPSTTILSDWTYTALCDGQDNIWVSTVAGVSVLSEKSPAVIQYTGNSPGENSLSNDLAYIVFIDSKNYVWIGTADGLNKVDPKTGTIKKYFTSDGLPSNLIIDIMEDDAHDIWISTTNGLSKFHPGDNSFKNFSTQDGLATNEFNKLASFKNPNSEMYFGGRGGLTCFNPDSIKINNYIPPVYITGFKLFNKEVKIGTEGTSTGFFIAQQVIYCKEVTLEHNQNVITFEFAALNYLCPEKNQYKYELEGFDNHWSFAGYKREVTYTNLDPGKYNFRVMASNNDGVWNNVGASLKIVVKPPFWRTGWAYAAYFSFIVILLYVFRRFTLHEAGIKRKLELEEIEIQKLHEMDLLKMQFFANVSHEFRTPLTLIIGPIEKLLHDVKDELYQIDLKLISRNAKRLLRLINQLMDFRKIEEAKLELNLTKSDIVLFVKDIMDTFNQDAVQRNINFDFKYSYPSLEVWFDTDKLDKIIYNLLSNAFKFTRDGGTVTASLDINDASNLEGISKHDKNAVLSGNKTLKISVKDSGIGIPKDVQKRIFDRFYQVKNTLTSQGTGIGLSLTNELVKLHHGSIMVESEPDKGSEFVVILPLWLDEAELPQLSPVYENTKLINTYEEEILVEENLEDNKTGQEQKLKEGLPKVLIIEDNSDMRLFIKNEFKNNYHVCEARDGIMGLQKAYEEIPDAIICDVMMPGKDGYEVCRALKDDKRTSHIPIVMLTAKGSEQHTIQGFESGADDYVAKPFSSAVLRARIKNLIEARISLRRKFMREPFAALAEISPSKTDEKLFQKVYSIVEKNLNNPDFDVNDFASEIGMSRTQLYRKIHALSGESVKEFIRVVRLKKAAEFLVTTDNNVSEVAYSVGFNSLSYFTTSFTEYFGMNPTKFTEKHAT